MGVSRNVFAVDIQIFRRTDQPSDGLSLIPPFDASKHPCVCGISHRNPQPHYRISGNDDGKARAESIHRFTKGAIGNDRHGIPQKG
jgi:hypothetical protein